MAFVDDDGRQESNHVFCRSNRQQAILPKRIDDVTSRHHTFQSNQKAQAPNLFNDARMCIRYCAQSLICLLYTSPSPRD